MSADGDYDGMQLMTTKKDIAYLKQCFSYNQDEGLLVWNILRPQDHFKSNANYRGYMTKWAGKRAGSIDKDGYLQISTMNTSVHRIVWAIFYNEWPENTIDHIDRCKTNNKITNLRDVSNQENLKNAKISKRNKSGATGVFWRPNRMKWEATICVNSKLISLGAFSEKSQAIAVRKSAQIKYGFHSNHGC